MANCPDAEGKLHGEELTVRYRTQKFVVHCSNKTGEFAEQAHADEGPKFRGSLLHADFHAARPTRVLFVPSDVQEPYWTTFVNDFAIGTGKDAAFASTTLSSNRGTDPKLLEWLKASLAADEKPVLATTLRKPTVENVRGDTEKKPRRHPTSRSRPSIPPPARVDPRRFRFHPRRLVLLFPCLA